MVNTYATKKNINVDKQDMVNLREEMKRLANQLKLVGSSQVSEIMQQKVNNDWQN
jgi:hypothetical protein